MLNATQIDAKKSNDGLQFAVAFAKTAIANANANATFPKQFCSTRATLFSAPTRNSFGQSTVRRLADLELACQRRSRLRQAPSKSITRCSCLRRLFWFGADSTRHCINKQKRVAQIKLELQTRTPIKQSPDKKRRKSTAGSWTALL